MALNVPATTIVNTVKYKTDIASLKKVIADIKKVQKATSSASLGIATSPRNNQQAIRQIKARVTEQADAHIKAFQSVAKEKSALMQKNSQQFYADLFGYSGHGTSAAGSASAFMDSMRETKAMSKAHAEAIKENLKRDKTLENATNIGNAKRASARDVTGVTEGNFNFAANRTKIGGQELKEYQQRLVQLSASYRSGEISLRQYTSATRNLLTELKTEASQVQSLTGVLKDHKMMLAEIAGGLAGEFVHSVLAAGKSIQSIQSTMSTAFGDDTQHQMTYVMALSKEMGVGIENLSREYTAFAMSAKLGGMAAKDIESGFRTITAAGVAMGKTPDNMKHVMMAFREMAGEGRIYKTQMNMLARQLPGINELFAQALNPKLFAESPAKAATALREAMKKGMSAMEILPKVFKAMDETYNKNLEKNIHNLANEQERLNSQWLFWKNIMFTGGLVSASTRFTIIMEQLVTVTKPLAAMLGGITKGFMEIGYWVGLGAAYIEDFMVDLGILDDKTGQFKGSALDAWSSVGESIGEALAVFAGVRLAGLLLGLAKIAFGFKSIKIAAEQAAAAETAAGAGGVAGDGAKAKGGGTGGALTGIVMIDAAMHAAEAQYDNLMKHWGDKKSQEKSVNDYFGIMGGKNNPLAGMFGGSSNPNLPTVNSTRNQLLGAINQTQPISPYSQQPGKIEVVVKVQDGAVPGLVKAQIGEITGDMLNAGLAK